MTTSFLSSACSSPDLSNRFTHSQERLPALSLHQILAPYWRLYLELINKVEAIYSNIDWDLQSAAIRARTARIDANIIQLPTHALMLVSARAPCFLRLPFYTFCTLVARGNPVVGMRLAAPAAHKLEFSGFISAVWNTDTLDSEDFAPILSCGEGVPYFGDVSETEDIIWRSFGLSRPLMNHCFWRRTAGRALHQAFVGGDISLDVSSIAQKSRTFQSATFSRDITFNSFASDILKFELPMRCGPSRHLSSEPCPTCEELIRSKSSGYLSDGLRIGICQGVIFL